MKKFLGIILLYFPFMAFAQVESPTQIQRLTPPPTSGCELATKAFNWNDGDTLSLDSVQTILKDIKTPPGWSFTPQSAIDKVLALTNIYVPNVTYHCRNVNSPPAIAIFYFSFVQDNIPIRTPDISVNSPIPLGPIQRPMQGVQMLPQGMPSQGAQPPYQGMPHQGAQPYQAPYQGAPQGATVKPY